MKPLRISAGALALVFGLAGLGLAQETEADDKNDGERSSGWGMMRSFDRKAPDVGEPLPELTVYNADGQPIALDQLPGQHRVLVFGCLT